MSALGEILGKGNDDEVSPYGYYTKNTMMVFAGVVKVILWGTTGFVEPTCWHKNGRTTFWDARWVCCNFIERYA